MEFLQKNKPSEIYKSWRLSLFLIVCFSLGGTSQNIFKYKIIIYIISVLLITSAFLGEEHRDRIQVSPAIYVFFILVSLLFFIYLVPVPPSIWSELKGRDIIMSPFSLAGIDTLPWKSISLNPEGAIRALLALLPALAILAILGRSASKDEIANSQNVILLVGSLSVLFGVLQYFSNSPVWFLYDVTNSGASVGFFSNSNHQACFLSMVLGCAIIRVADRLRKGYFAPKYLVVILLLILGLVMTKSASAYVFLAWTLFLSLYYILQTRLVYFGEATKKIIGIGGIIIIAALIAAMGYIAHEFSSIETFSPRSRFGILRASLGIHDTFGFWGTGPGSFEQVFKLFEDRDLITNIFVPEAHNDYLQIWLEFGWLGLSVTLAALLWVLLNMFKLVRNIKMRNFHRWGFMVIATIPFIHSIWDYPLRTEAVSVLFIYVLILGTKRVVE